MSDEKPQFECFLDAIDAGDAATAAKLIREKKVLSSNDVAAIADLLDPELDKGPLDLKMLVIKNRARGAPRADPLQARQKQRIIAAKVRNRLKTEKKVDLAVRAAAVEVGVSLATAYRAWEKHKNDPLTNWIDT